MQKSANTKWTTQEIDRNSKWFGIAASTVWLPKTASWLMTATFVWRKSLQHEHFWHFWPIMSADLKNDPVLSFTFSMCYQCVICFWLSKIQHVGTARCLSCGRVATGAGGNIFTSLQFVDASVSFGSGRSTGPTLQATGEAGRRNATAIQLLGELNSFSQQPQNMYSTVVQYVISLYLIPGKNFLAFSVSLESGTALIICTNSSVRLWRSRTSAQFQDNLFCAQWRREQTWTDSQLLSVCRHHLKQYIIKYHKLHTVMITNINHNHKHKGNHKYG